jgi:hypothetical protein
MVPSTLPISKVSIESCISLKDSPASSAGQPMGVPGAAHWTILIFPPFLLAVAGGTDDTGTDVVVLGLGAAVVEVAGAAEVAGELAVTAGVLAAGVVGVELVPELQPEMIKTQTSKIATGMNNLFNCFLLLNNKITPNSRSLRYIKSTIHSL